MITSANNLTPMLRQYHELKRAHPGTLLFFRLGDFYELFFDDAVTGARELDITLTARHKESSNPVPMCGVPHHAASIHIARLIRKGYRVAICEQTEPVSAKSKLVRREVVRVITPGTAIDPQLIEAGESSYLAAICGGGKDKFGIALLDVTTGEFHATQTSGAEAWSEILAAIESYNPRELIYPVALSPLIEQHYTTPALSDSRRKAEDEVVIARINSSPEPSKSQTTTIPLTPLDDWLWEQKTCYDCVCQQLGVQSLDAYSLEDKPEAVRAAGVCLHYARESQRLPTLHINDISAFQVDDYLVLDKATVRNLDLIETQGDGESNRSLLGVIDATQTAMGARLLRSWVLRPSIKRGEIEARLNGVAEFHQTQLARDRVRATLELVTDIERLIGRVNMNTANARDLTAIRRALEQIPLIKNHLADASSSLLLTIIENLDAMDDVRSIISETLEEGAPVNVSAGGTIRTGVSTELDELRELSGNAKTKIAALESNERARSGINTLRIRFNNVFGYYIEVSRLQAERVPADYERRQTLANAERFTTPELKSLETRILGADERVVEIETEILNKLRLQIASETKRLQAVARALAMLDALAALAHVAVRRRYVKPVLHDSDELEIKAGRHPIIEAFSNSPFVPNDLQMNNSTDRLLVITGPNMGGKSTILRQTGLIAVLAQIGSFVPAESARLPIFDRVWTRVGAADDISRGRSTFMVEMIETAAIMRQATARSLVLLDEIGRGTATFDGLSIAWAIAEHLHDSPAHAAKTLFATHYHELTELADRLPGAQNYHIRVAERDGEIFFLYRFEHGSASKSYGIEVARLAGMPREILNRAREVLTKLEQYELQVFSEVPKSAASNGENSELQNFIGRATRKQLATQATLFDQTNKSVLDELRNFNLETLSPEQAKTLLTELQQRVV